MAGARVWSSASGHLVVGLVGVAAFDAGERGLGEGGLDAEDGGCGGAPWSVRCRR